MHNLHGPDRLFETRFGHILQCKCCNRVQITFRDHVLLVDEDELELLVQTIHRAWTQLQQSEDESGWRLQAGTDGGPISIVLSQPSLRALHKLLQGAWDMYVLQERVQAVASGQAGTAHDVLRDHVPHMD